MAGQHDVVFIGHVFEIRPGGEIGIEVTVNPFGVQHALTITEGADLSDLNNQTVIVQSIRVGEQNTDIATLDAKCIITPKDPLPKPPSVNALVWVGRQQSESVKQT